MLKSLLNRILATPQAPAPAPAPEVALEIEPGDAASADTLIAEGNREEDAGNLALAEALYRRAVAAAPRHARAHLNLGIVLAARDDNDGAARAYEAVLAIDPRHAAGNYNFARLAFMRGDFVRAQSLVRQALQARPEFVEALGLLGNVLESLEELPPAAEALQAVVRLQPDNAEAWLSLTLLLFRLRRFAETEDAARRVIQLVPDHATCLAMVALLVGNAGLVDEALELLRKAIGLEPENLTFRARELLLMQSVEGVSAKELFVRHVEFGSRMERAFPARFDGFPGRSEPGRRLRIGYVSADFSLHPVMFFLMPILKEHDRAAFEIFCYSCGMNADYVTQRARESTDHWLDAQGMSDLELADAIHADGIDVLIDLNGHTNGARLGVFSQRPAPVQVTWVGYLNTTGLTRMDYRLTDRRCDPVEISQPLHTERLFAMPESQWCYQPQAQVAVAPVAPIVRNGFVTFGSFNSTMKISPATARRWARILGRLPKSRLRIADCNSERKRAEIRREMANAGISEDRFEFANRVPLTEYMTLYNAVDVALDSFPYGGGTTTFDALWMGVPVVTAIGDLPMSRSAASILSALGLDAWIAPTIEDFVDLVVERASDFQAITSLRRTLRPRLEASPLTDSVRYVRDLEAAYRSMWEASGP